MTQIYIDITKSKENEFTINRNILPLIPAICGQITK